ncbi:MAG: DNA cytosine methyltransferase [Fimbriimonadaceae bacterium]
MAEDSRRKYNVLSLFAGAGGLDLGFEQTGRFQTLAAVEYQPEFAETLRLNQRNGYFPKMRVYEADIRELDPHQVAQECFPDGRVDVIIGGPPCETFSLTGKLAGTNDPRGVLTSQYVRWVIGLRPQAFLMENVPRLSMGVNRAYLLSEIDRLQRCGYTVEYRVLCAADYGAFTLRNRLIVIGAADAGRVRWQEPSYSSAGSLLAEPYRTVREALAGLPAVTSAPSGVPDHVAANHIPSVIARFTRLKQGEWDTVRRRGRLSWDKPAPTLFAGTVRSVARHIHPDEPRELTNRECARIHGFPDDFLFAGRPPAVCKQIANSVPVEFARALGLSVAQTLDAFPLEKDRCVPLSAQG